MPVNRRNNAEQSVAIELNRTCPRRWRTRSGAEEELVGRAIPRYSASETQVPQPWNRKGHSVAQKQRADQMSGVRIESMYLPVIHIPNQQLVTENTEIMRRANHAVGRGEDRRSRKVGKKSAAPRMRGIGREVTNIKDTGRADKAEVGHV